MTRNLSISMRPRRFSEMVGQTQVVTALVKQLESGRIPAAFLFVGPTGCGKTTIARILALTLNCEHGPYGEPCDTCYEYQQNFNIIERNAAHLSKVEDSRDLVTNSGLDLVPMMGNHQVVILDECQQMTPEAQNVILKYLETESTHVVFIFCTTEPQKLLKTIKGRCLSFQMNPLTEEDVRTLVARAAALVEFQGDCEPLITELSAEELCGPRNIVMSCEKFFSGVPASEAVLNEEVSTIDVMALCRASVYGDWNKCRQLLLPAKAADVEALRHRMSRYYAKVLLDTNFSTRADLLSRFIYELSDHTANTYEKDVLLNATIASIYRICQMVATERQKQAA